MQKLSLACCVLAMAFISACAGIEQTESYYIGWSAQELAEHPTVITCDQVEQVLPMPDSQAIAQLARQLFEQGYFICGYSVPQTDGKLQVMQQAETLGACMVYFAEQGNVQAYYVVRLDSRNYGIMCTGYLNGQKLESGVLVVGLRADGPGARAGLRFGDILLKINDQPVIAQKTLDPYLHYGASNKLEIDRHGQKLSLQMQLPPLP